MIALTTQNDRDMQDDILDAATPEENDTQLQQGGQNA